jgi:hypothetical protein
MHQLAIELQFAFTEFRLPFSGPGFGLLLIIEEY